MDFSESDIDEHWHCYFKIRRTLALHPVSVLSNVMHACAFIRIKIAYFECKR